MDAKKVSGAGIGGDRDVGPYSLVEEIASRGREGEKDLAVKSFRRAPC